MWQFRCIQNFHVFNFAKCDNFDAFKISMFSILLNVTISMHSKFRCFQFLLSMKISTLYNFDALTARRRRKFLGYTRIFLWVSKAKTDTEITFDNYLLLAIDTISTGAGSAPERKIGYNFDGIKISMFSILLNATISTHSKFPCFQFC